MATVADFFIDLPAPLAYMLFLAALITDSFIQSVTGTIIPGGISVSKTVIWVIGKVLGIDLPGIGATEVFILFFVLGVLWLTMWVSQGRMRKN